jgi:cytochrome b
MKVRVWDLPLRLFHWLLTAAVVVAFVTAKIGGNAMVWHGRAGLLIIGLLAFRIVWGFVGSTHSRFASFVRGPGAILAYLKGQWHGSGHNPLGALSVLGLLGVLALQGSTGLFSNDDIAFQGYLHPLVGADLSERITDIHEAGEKLLILLVALHLGAIAFYARVKKQNLVKPMITGWTDAEPATDTPADRRLGGIAAFLVAAAIGTAAAYAASGALLLPPPPAAAAETPAW